MTQSSFEPLWKHFQNGSHVNGCFVNRPCDFHGTALSITAHPTRDNPGVDPPPLDLSNLSKTDTVKIPDEYAIVPYAEEWSGDIRLPPIPTRQATPPDTINPRRIIPELTWLEHVKEVMINHEGEIQTTPVTYLDTFLIIKVIMISDLEHLLEFIQH